MQIRCPTCNRQSEVPDDFRWRPFCSRRCKMTDLGNWLDEVYRFSRPLRADDLSDDEITLSVDQLERDLLVRMSEDDAS